MVKQFEIFELWTLSQLLFLILGIVLLDVRILRKLVLTGFLLFHSEVFESKCASSSDFWWSVVRSSFQIFVYFRNHVGVESLTKVHHELKVFDCFHVWVFADWLEHHRLEMFRVKLCSTLPIAQLEFEKKFGLSWVFLFKHRRADLSFKFGTSRSHLTKDLTLCWCRSNLRSFWRPWVSINRFTATLKSLRTALSWWGNVLLCFSFESVLSRSFGGAAGLGRLNWGSAHLRFSARI